MNIKDFYLFLAKARGLPSKHGQALVHLIKSNDLDFSFLLRKTPFSYGGKLAIYLENLQDFAFRVLIFSFSERKNGDDLELKSDYLRLCLLNCWKDCQLIQAHQALIAHILDLPHPFLDSSVNSSGSVFCLGGKSTRPFSPCDQALLAVLWACLAKQLNAKDLCQKALDCALWHKGVLDHLGHPHYSLFVKHKEHRKIELLFLHFILFRIAFSLTLDSCWGDLAYLQAQELQKNKIEGTQNLPFFILLSMYVDRVFNIKLAPKGGDYHPEGMFVDDALSLFAYHASDMSLVLTLAGRSNGMGAIRYQKEMGILNFGPQYYPLEKVKNFGIDKHFLFSEPLKYQYENERAALSTYFRMFNQDVLGKDCLQRLDYAYCDVLFYKQKLKLSLQFLGLEKEMPLAFVFYIQAGRCWVDGKPLEKKSLEHYKGDAREIVFEHEGSQFALLCEGKQSNSAELIPLAGGKHFWGADFLLSFGLDRAFSKVFWEIERR